MARSRMFGGLRATYAATSVLAVLASQASAQNGQECEVQYMPWDELPKQSMMRVDWDHTLIPFHLSSPQDPVIQVRVGLPLGEIDVACPDSIAVDLVGGDVFLWFYHENYYYVEAVHQSGASSGAYFDVHGLWNAASATDGSVLTGDPDPGVGGNRHYKIEYDEDSVAIYEPDDHRYALVLCGDPDTAPHKNAAETGSVDEVQQIVCDAFAANGNQPVKLSLHAHGTEDSEGNPVGGTINLGGLSNPRIDGDNVADYGEALCGKVCSISIYSCYGGLGEAGDDLLIGLAESAKCDVCGYTGCVLTTLGWRFQWSPPMWFRQIKMSTNGAKKIARYDPDNLVTEIFIDDADFFVGDNIVVDPAKIRLPLSRYGAEGTSPVAEIVQRFGGPADEWDINNDGTINEVDVDYLVAIFGL